MMQTTPGTKAEKTAEDDRARRSDQGGHFQQERIGRRLSRYIPPNQEVRSESAQENQFKLFTLNITLL